MQGAHWHFSSFTDRTVWQQRSCRTGLATRLQTSVSGVFQPICVAHLAALIAKSCLTEVQGMLGGTIRFGTDYEFIVGMGAANGPKVDNVIS